MQASANTDKEQSAERVHAAKATRVPLKIDDEVIVRSLTNSAHRTKSKIIGAVHGDFILIREPIVMINDRLYATIEDNFICSYFTEGYLYNFRSKYRRHLVSDIVCIDYPKEVEVKQVRRHRRIRVNIETQFSFDGTSDIFAGDMLDISHGGCRLVLNTLLPVTKGTSTVLTFCLPDEEAVSGLKCTVMSVKHIKMKEVTEIGLAFIGPRVLMEKIAGFCEFCMFFEVD